MSFLTLPLEMVQEIGSYCVALNNYNANDLINLRFTCKSMNEKLRSTFWNIYIQNFYVPLTPAGLDRLRFFSKPEMQYHVKTLRLDAGCFINTGDMVPEDAEKDIVDHPQMEDQAIRWNEQAWELVGNGTLMKTFSQCLPQFSNLKGLNFRPPDLDEVFSEKNNRVMSERWRLLLEILLPMALRKVPHVRSIEIEDSFCRPYCWRTGWPEYRRDPIPIGAPLSVISLLLGSGVSLEALRTLKLSLTIRESAVNDDYATLLQRGLKTLKSLESLHLSFESHDQSAPAFFDNLVQGVDELPLRHLGLTLLTPSPGSLSKLLSKCKDIESITLLLVELSLQEWQNGWEHDLSRWTLVGLNLGFINIGDQRVDFSRCLERGRELSHDEEYMWLNEDGVANVRIMATEFKKLQESAELLPGRWTIGHVLADGYSLTHRFS